MLVPETITCVDCGGDAHLLTTWDPDEPPRPGDLATYRCRDCLDRWDTIVPDGEGEAGGADGTDGSRV